MRAYKVFNPDWTCRGFQYEVGKTYRIDGKVEMCENGFHACKKLVDCFQYYRFDPNNKVAEVELSGDILGENENKQCSSVITIVKELTWHEVLDLSNTGDRNTGDRNTGNWNTGNWNTGHSNTGHSNTGYSNTGDRNTGDWNTGDWNTGDWNTGYFNTDSPKARMFNKETDVSRSKIKFPSCFFFDLTKWITFDSMSDDEKKEHPEAETLGGYLKAQEYKEAWANALKDISEDVKNEIRSLPNYDPDIFEEITGVRV